MAYRSYSERNFRVSFWRTKDGHEVDFVIEDGIAAIEVKGADKIGGDSLKGLNAFREEHHPKKAILVCQEPKSRRLESGIDILPWRVFLERMWDGDLF